MSNPFNAPLQRMSQRGLPSRLGTLAAMLALAGCVLVAGCAIPTHPDSAAGPSNPLNPAAVQLLDDTSWVLERAQTSDGNTAFDVPTDKAAAPTLVLDTHSGQRRASGFAGCNRFSAPYELTSGKLTFDALVTTRKACGAEADRIERAYLDALEHAGAALVQMRPPQEMRIIATTGLTLTFLRDTR